MPFTYMHPSPRGQNFISETFFVLFLISQLKYEPVNRPLCAISRAIFSDIGNFRHASKLCQNLSLVR
jgi:hypothetical protein